MLEQKSCPCSRKASTFANPLEYELTSLYSTKSKALYLGSVNTLNNISDKKTSPFRVENMIRAER